ncbi:MAG: DUF4386 domain-containing protein [candidate division Zixibacteria bacterium]|nr:DUF4386 domain-containing protein [candidate division Zixibacteria bacterium]
MTNIAPNESQHKAARIAGFTLIFAIAIVVISNYSVGFRFIVSDVAETARNMLAHETLFRFNIICNLIYLATLILMSTSLYVILKPVNKNFALTAALTRFVYASMWAIMAINTFGALRLLGDAGFLKVFETDQLQALSRLLLNNSWDAYYVGLPFWGLAATVCSYLLLKSKYIPKTLAIFGITSSAWCVFCAFAYLIFPGYGEIVHIGLFDVPLTIFELTLGFWLLIKGLKAQPNPVNQ